LGISSFPQEVVNINIVTSRIDKIFESLIGFILLELFMSVQLIILI